MAIGEFGGAPAVPGGVLASTPLYWLYELTHAALNPARAAADATRLLFRNPLNPLYSTSFGKSVVAAAEMFERSTRRYGQPDWRISSTLVGGERVPVHITSVWERPFCRVLHFERVFERPPRRPQPRLLLVAPLSGHYATLLRGTVEAFLPNHDVYITEWRDARTVPLAEGMFDLDDYIDYVISILHALGGETHVVAVCQPAVPVLAAAAVMEADDDPHLPVTMTLMGGPIDTRVNPTAVNMLAQKRGINWFRHNVITKVPFPNPGFMRDVYPGFLQLNGFISMNLDRHIEAHRQLFLNLVKGDGDSAQKHKEFYDEYLAVMDLSAEYLSANSRHRVRASRAAEGRNDASRPAGRSGADPARGPADRRRRARRYFRRWSDRSGAPAMRQHAARAAGALVAARRRPLWCVQRLAFPVRDRPPHRRLHPVDEPRGTRPTNRGRCGPARQRGCARAG